MIVYYVEDFGLRHPSETVKLPQEDLLDFGTPRLRSGPNNENRHLIRTTHLWDKRIMHRLLMESSFQLDLALSGAHPRLCVMRINLTMFIIMIFKGSGYESVHGT